MAGYFQCVLVVQLNLSTLEYAPRLHCWLSHEPQSITVFPVGGQPALKSTPHFQPHGRYQLKFNLQKNQQLYSCTHLHLLLTGMRRRKPNDREPARAVLGEGELRLYPTTENKLELRLADDPSLVKGTVTKIEVVLPSTYPDTPNRLRILSASRTLAEDYIKDCLNVYSGYSNSGWMFKKSPMVEGRNRFVSMTHKQRFRDMPIEAFLANSGKQKALDEDLLKTLLDRALILCGMSRSEITSGARSLLSKKNEKTLPLTRAENEAAAVLMRTLSGYVHMLRYVGDYALNKHEKIISIDTFDDALIAAGGQSGSDCEDMGRAVYELIRCFRTSEQFKDELLDLLRNVSQHYIFFGILCDVSHASYDPKIVGSAKESLNAHFMVMGLPKALADKFVKRANLNGRDLQNALRGSTEKHSSSLTQAVTALIFKKPFPRQLLWPVLIGEGTGRVSPKIRPERDYSSDDPEKASQDALDSHAALKKLNDAKVLETPVSFEARNFSSAHSRTSDQPLNPYYRYAVEALTMQSIEEGGNVGRMLWVNVNKQQNKLTNGVSFNSIVYGDDDVGLLCMPDIPEHVQDLIQHHAAHSHPVMVPSCVKKPFEEEHAIREAVSKFNRTETVHHQKDHRIVKAHFMVNKRDATAEMVRGILQKCSDTNSVTHLELYVSRFDDDVGEYLFTAHVQL